MANTIPWSLKPDCFTPTTFLTSDAFVSSLSAIIDRWGLDGLDIDFEGHSIYLNNGDRDFKNPTTPVVVNLISALKTLRSSGQIPVAIAGAMIAACAAASVMPLWQVTR